MVVTGSWSVFLIGAAGGVLGELLHWWHLRKDERLPDYARNPIYWTITALMVAAGGGVSWLYFGEQAEGIVALHVGLATPLILQKLATAPPDTSGGRPMVARPPASWRTFFTW